jgi:Hypervirulence associated proteins TUDOR domain
MAPLTWGRARPMAEFKRGDKVTWRSHGGQAAGRVEKEITEDTEAAGRSVKASKDDPQYLVTSDKSGGEAVHKPSALKKDSK